MQERLSRILETVRARNEAMKATLGPNDTDRLVRQREDSPRPFAAVLSVNTDKTMIVAEIKRASPSRGPIAEELDPWSLAREFEQGGATAVSVVTERAFYHGSLADMQAAREGISIPVLRNDFIIDPYQVPRSYGTGADAIQVTIPAVEDDAVLHQIFDSAANLRLDILTEVYDEHDVARLLEIGKDSPNALRLVGINCANFSDDSIDLDKPARLAPMLPETSILLSHSGIRSREDIDRVRASCPRVTRFLVGEALVRAENPVSLLSALLDDKRRKAT